MSAAQVKRALSALANPERAKHSVRFFKTGPGEYGAGDKFLGITVPQQRQIAKKFKDLPLTEVEKLLHSSYHDHRLTALVILTYQFPKADSSTQIKIYNFYLKNTRYINNWDLVDLSAPKIVGQHLLDKPEQRTILYQLVKSKNLWERRIAILATFSFIKQTDFKDALQIAELLVKDNHDLIHKAVGWMLREIGKQDEKVLLRFLDQYASTMPRTMLRYSIEKLTPARRSFYLKKS